MIDETHVLQTHDMNSLKRTQSEIVSPFPREELKRVKIGEVAKNHDEEHKGMEEILSPTEKFIKFSKSVQT
jgi:hypothetical protein